MVIYRATSREGYIYDMSLNPSVDFNILQATRKVESMEIMSPPMTIVECVRVLRQIYDSPQIGMLPVVLKKNAALIAMKIMKIRPVHKVVKSSEDVPSIFEIEKLEEYIKGRIVTFEQLLRFKDKLEMTEERLADTLQALYCLRRIRLVGAYRQEKGKKVCSICGLDHGYSCEFGTCDDDIVAYEADNYYGPVEKPVREIEGRYSAQMVSARKGLSEFVETEQREAQLWCAPKSFKYCAISGAAAEVMKKGGRVLYVTSSVLVNVAKSELSKLFKHCNIGVVSKDTELFRSFDLCIASYKSYMLFNKAFDLVILDARYAYIDPMPKSFEYVLRKAVKDNGQFLKVSSCPDDSIQTKVMLPVSCGRKPIPEPRMHIYRYLKPESLFIPESVTDTIMYSLHQKIPVVIFTPTENMSYIMYEMLSDEEMFKDFNIDMSDRRHNSIMLDIKMGKCDIAVSCSMDDTLYENINVNVIVMCADYSSFDMDTLINIAAMGVKSQGRLPGEVVFVAAEETDEMSLTKEKIRKLNKEAWQKGYIDI